MAHPVVYATGRNGGRSRDILFFHEPETLGLVRVRSFVLVFEGWEVDGLFTQRKVARLCQTCLVRCRKRGAISYTTPPSTTARQPLVALKHWTLPSKFEHP